MHQFVQLQWIRARPVRRRRLQEVAAHPDQARSGPDQGWTGCGEGLQAISRWALPLIGVRSTEDGSAARGGAVEG